MTVGNRKTAGTFSPPCCLVFVGQDRLSWVPGPLLSIFERQTKLKTPMLHKATDKVEVLHLFRCSTHTHTRPPAGGWKLRPRQWNEYEDEKGMEMRWNEHEMKDTQPEPEEGNAKEDRKEKTTTPTHLARNGRTLKGQEKRKVEVDGSGTRPAEGGKTGAPGPNYQQSVTQAYPRPKNAQDQTYLERGAHMKIWDQWGLVKKGYIRNACKLSW